MEQRFLQVIKKNQGLIHKVCSVYCDIEEDRSDLFQEIVAQLWKSFPNFKGKSKVSTWIYRVALNTAMNYRNNSRKKRGFLQDAIGFYPDEPSTEMDSNPQVELLYDCIAELDEFNKAIILLYLDGYKHDEIAEITGISKTNVGTRILRIKEQLRSKANKKQVRYGT